MAYAWGSGYYGSLYPVLCTYRGCGSLYRTFYTYTHIREEEG